MKDRSINLDAFSLPALHNLRTTLQEYQHRLDFMLHGLDPNYWEYGAQKRALAQVEGEIAKREQKSTSTFVSV